MRATSTASSESLPPRARRAVRARHKAAAWPNYELVMAQGHTAPGAPTARERLSAQLTGARFVLWPPASAVKCLFVQPRA